MTVQLKSLKEIGTPNILLCVARVPGSERLIVGSSDFNVYEIDIAAEKPEFISFNGEGHQSYVTGVALTAGGEVVSGSYDGRLIWWNLATREPVRTVDAHEKWIRGVRVSPDGTMLASVADDMLCKLWDAATGELRHTLADHRPVTPHNYPSMLYAQAFSPDGRLLATGDKVGHIALWDTASGSELAELEAPVMYTWDPKQRRHSIGGIRSLTFSPDSRLLAVGGIGTIGNIDHLGGPARVEVFDWQAGKRLHELSDEQLKGLVEQIAFHPGGEWFVTAGGDNAGFVTIYETASGKLLHQEKAGQHVHALTVNDDFTALYTVHHGRVTKWSVGGVE